MRDSALKRPRTANTIEKAMGRRRAHARQRFETRVGVHVRLDGGGGRRRAHARQRFETGTRFRDCRFYPLVGEELMRDSALKREDEAAGVAGQRLSEKSSCATAL